MTNFIKAEITNERYENNRKYVDWVLDELQKDLVQIPRDTIQAFVYGISFGPRTENTRLCCYSKTGGFDSLQMQIILDMVRKNIPESIMKNNGNPSSVLSFFPWYKRLILRLIFLLP